MIRKFGKTMVRVSSTEFLKGYGELSDRALVEPVTITRNGRDRLVVMSADIYEQLQRAASPRSRPIEALDADEIAAIAAAEVPEEFAHLDQEAHA